MNEPLTPPAVRPAFGKNAASVLAVFAAIVLLMLGFAAFAVAKTGLVHVPLMSRFYTGPEPVRVIEASALTTDQFRALMEERIATQIRSGAKPPYTVEITEQEITGALHGVINLVLQDKGWRAERSQVALTPKGIEFFGHLERGRTNADVRIRFDAIIENGSVRFEPTDIRFGDYPIHPALAQKLAGYLFARDVGTWMIQFGDAKLESVRFSEGKLELTASPQAAAAL
jgi:hypothetical protein